MTLACCAGSCRSTSTPTCCRRQGRPSSVSTLISKSPLSAAISKSTCRLVAAYDDAAGVTARFNRNVLAVVNRELDADFDVDAYRHVARWNGEQERMEMSLRAERA